MTVNTPPVTPLYIMHNSELARGGLWHDSMERVFVTKDRGDSRSH